MYSMRVMKGQTPIRQYNRIHGVLDGSFELKVFVFLYS